MSDVRLSLAQARALARIHAGLPLEDAGQRADYDSAKRRLEDQIPSPAGLIVVRDHRAGPIRSDVLHELSSATVADAELVVVVPDEGVPTVRKARDPIFQYLLGRVVDVA